MTAPTGWVPFDPTAPLPARTLVEASAGTGKTYALCGLTAYLIASGARIDDSELTIDQLLVVTFTRLATEDLKNRIRERLVTVREDLADGRSGSDDPVLDGLARGAVDRDAAIERLDRARSDLGNLTVSTIHGFAQRSLALFGSAVGVEADLEVIVDETGLRTDAISDQLALQSAALSTVDFDTRRAADAPDADEEDPPTSAELSWIPPAARVRDIVELLENIPDLQILPELPSSYLELVRQHRSEYDTQRAEVIEQIRALPAERSKGKKQQACKPLEKRFDELEIIRSAWIAVAAAANARERRRSARVRNFGDLLGDLRGALTGSAESTGQDLARRIRDRHRIALIDEFQDTDRVQWDIFDACFGTGRADDPSRLVLVGDPKQAIYRFRGADVYTYAQVADSPRVTRRALPTNHRSDAPLLLALDAIFTGTSFGPAAAFTPVGWPERNAGAGIRWKSIEPDGWPPLPALRLVTNGLTGAESNTGPAEGTHDAAEADLVDWLRRLRSRAELRASATDRTVRIDQDGTRWRDVSYRDIAILVTSNASAVKHQELLDRHGIPAVIHTDDDVRIDTARSGRNHHTRTAEPVISEAAWNWQLLLEAIAQPSDPARARAAAGTVFGPDGFTPTAPSGPTPDADATRIFEAFQADLAGWARRLTERGAASLVAHLRAETPWVDRTAHRNDGGRLMTDMGHVGELFSSLVGSGPTSADELLAVLQPRPDIDEAAAELVRRRLASEKPAVTIMTIHKAKGLEFPIVCSVGLHQARAPQQDARGSRTGARFHDPETGREILDVARSDDSLAAEQYESDHDDLRKLYVALTRARNHAFIYWKPPTGSPGPLHRVLFAPPTQRSSRTEQPAEEPVADARALGGLLERSIPDASTGLAPVPTIGWVELAGHDIDLADDHGMSTRHRDDIPDHTQPLEVRTLDGRPLDRRARRWSFTAIGAAAHHRADPDPASTAGTDEGTDADPDDEPAGDVAAGSTAGQLQDLAAGPRFGTFVHQVLEGLDFTDDPTAVHRAVEEHHIRSPIDLSRTGSGQDGLSRLSAGLHDALGAPIGPLGPAGSALRLRDIRRADRLDECDFDLRLDTTTGGVSTGSMIGRILDRHLPGDDPYRPWAEELVDGRFDLDLAGLLTGSIDLVYRVTHVDGTTRFHVADYKTNRNPRGDYSPGSLVAMMTDHDYPLQALLYQVALHRYLRWRLPGHDPAENLGAVTYLFLRGMTGDGDSGDADVPPGVARWDIPPRVVTDLDALFAGETVDPT